MLRNILSLPLLAFVDLSIDSKDLIESGLLEAHKTTRRTLYQIRKEEDRLYTVYR